MSDEDVIKAGTLIAYFCMDAKCLPVGISEPKHLKYHLSWDWIMPACKKFTDEIGDNMHTKSELLYNRYIELCEDIESEIIGYKIDAVLYHLSILLDLFQKSGVFYNWVTPARYILEVQMHKSLKKLPMLLQIHHTYHTQNRSMNFHHGCW